MEERKPPWKAIIVSGISFLLLTVLVVGSAYAKQVPLPGSAIDQFVDPLPILDATGAPNGTIQTIMAGTSQMVVEMKEFRANMLPSTFVPGNGGSYTGTWVWGYVTGGTNTSTTRDTYTGPVVVATRGTPSEFKFVNDLGYADSTHVLAYKNSTDQSLHWANPDSVDRYDPNNPNSSMPKGLEWIGNPSHYDGSIPAAVHLHGAEDPAAVDGGPESWFTSSGQHGKAFYSKDGNPNGNYAIYRYPNVQEAAPLWFHDHTLGATRLNVFSGLAGAYVLTDPDLALPTGLDPIGLRDLSHPADDILIPLVVQDRMFDTDGQLYFPNQGINPEHKYWIPEFFGDTIAVNGKVWPYLNVKAQRYRFLLINGSNARTYILTFGASGPPLWQIGTDQGYLDNPVQVNQLVIMPGERAEFIVDFGGLSVGDQLVLKNLGPDDPFGGGVPDEDFDTADPSTTGKVMQFRVVAGALVPDSSFNPAATNATIRSGNDTIIRLVNPATGTIPSNVSPDLTRELTLVEISREFPIKVGGTTYEGGPLEVLVNNTKWNGLRPDENDPNLMSVNDLDPVNGATPDGIGNWLTELPHEGTTEVWEIVNTTADAHPIHTHLAQFQLLNRQAYNADEYFEAYAAAFPGGDFIPAYGPPLAYGPSAASGGKYGGNPNVNPFLMGPVMPPNPNEAGWKDTVFVPPGFVTRFVIRWAPTDLSVASSSSSQLHYAFLPNDYIPGTASAIFDYVWHCHIIDHEDNEMMRPDAVIPKPGASRSFVMGTDY